MGAYRIEVIQGKSRDDIQSCIANLVVDGPLGLNRYGMPMFRSRFALLRHAVRRTAVAKPLPKGYFVQKRYRPSAHAMEIAHELGAMLFLELGTEKTPLPEQILAHLGYYKTFLGERDEKNANTLK